MSNVIALKNPSAPYTPTNPCDVAASLAQRTVNLLYLFSIPEDERLSEYPQCTNHKLSLEWASILATLSIWKRRSKAAEAKGLRDVSHLQLVVYGNELEKNQGTRVDILV